MVFFSGISNFGSKILTGMKNVTKQVASELHKVSTTISGPVGMIHPGIGRALGAGANLASAMDRLQIRTVRQLITKDIAYRILYQKRGNSSGGMISNEEYQLFIDYNNALVYAANSQIVDGMTSDFALKIKPNGLLTINNLNVIKFDFVAQINYGTVWMFDAAWYNSVDIVPDQVTSACGATPKASIEGGIVETNTEYAREDQQHLLQVSTILPAKDTATGEDGVANTYARFDHIHHVNINNDVLLKDSGTGTASSSNIVASATHQQSFNVDPTTTNVPPVNATAATNGTGYDYCRNDHVHTQQLTYVEPLTSTMFINRDAQATEYVAKTGKTLQIIEEIIRKRDDDEKSIAGDYLTRKKINDNYVSIAIDQTITGTYANVQVPQRYIQNAGKTTSFAGVTCGADQINPNGNNYNYGLRISQQADSQYNEICLGCIPPINR
ncbi:MAG: hypothetical protein EZS28_000989 [Streblomastix strix]|uniref:Uncharacterized protein n=1 Tax=Streblomastix strix TaxID=222440 RepID=A0A5J4X8C1_9EUKA|nr:MAG: hypothetical protein EZS28_000989 [Streblomastix strix]